MMQDYPLTLRELATAPPRVGVTVFEDALGGALTHRLYAPAKNGMADARLKAAKGVPDASCCSAELALYASNCLMLRDAGVRVAPPKQAALGGIAQPEWAHIVLLPSFLPLWSHIPTRFLRPDLVSISQRSTLVLEGDIVFTGALELDGALDLRAAPGVQLIINAMRVSNAGVAFVDVDDNDPDEDELFRIRGFRPGQGSILIYRFREPGRHVIQDLTSLTTLSADVVAAAGSSNLGDNGAMKKRRTASPDLVEPRAVMSE